MADFSRLAAAGARRSTRVPLSTFSRPGELRTELQLGESTTVDASSSAPIFVVGAARSGTTLLRLMLNEHPQVSIPAESHLLGPLMRTFGPTAMLSGSQLEQATTIVASCAEWQRDFAHTEEELRATLGTIPITIEQFIDRVFRLEVGRDVGRWGDKTPANLHWVGPLLACFPSGQAVAIVRDPRDVYLSLAPYGWFGTSTWDIGRYIAHNGASITRWREQCSPDRFSILRYEDLVLDTERTLRDLCTWLGLPYANSMNAFFEHAATNVQGWELDMGVHDKLMRPPSPDDVGRWKREGARRDHAEIEALTSGIFVAFGYERRVSDRALGPLRLEARARHHARTPGELVTRNLTQVRRRTRALLRRGDATPTGS
jgi:hypothetical protein